MPILIEIRERARRLKKDVIAEWRQEFLLALSAQVEDYCQTWGVSPLLWRCPHGIYLASDPGEFEPECAVCQPLFFTGKPGRRVGEGLWINDSLPGRLDKFPRKGRRTINLTGYLDWYENEPYYFPPDHYVSPYDNRLRFRKTETAGGYRCADFGDDGTAISAPLGWGETLDGDIRQHGRAFSEDELDDKRANYGPRFKGSWYYTKHDISRLKAYFFPRYRSAGLSLPPNALAGSSVLTFFDDERTAMEWDGKYRCVGTDWTDRKPTDATPTVSGVPKKFTPKNCTAARFLSAAEKALDFSAWAGRWNGYSWTHADAGLSDKDVRRWRYEHWSMRAKYSPPPNRKPWPKDWKTERKMRDLAAGLNMYRYGDGALQPTKMMQAAWLNLRESQAVFNERYGAVC